MAWQQGGGGSSLAGQPLTFPFGIPREAAAPHGTSQDGGNRDFHETPVPGVGRQDHWDGLRAGLGAPDSYPQLCYSI